MSPLEWLKYRLYGIVARRYLQIIVIIIIAGAVFGATFLYYQFLPRPIISVDLSYKLDPFTDNNSDWYLIIQGSVKNSGTMNATCTMVLDIQDTRGYNVSDQFDIGTITPGSELIINKRYDWPYLKNDLIINLGNIFVSYKIYW